MRPALAAALALGLAALLAAPALAPALPVRWLKGDLHVHTTRSHDVCDPLQPLSQKCLDAPYSAGFSPVQQALNAQLRGLDFLAITDHDVEPWQPAAQGAPVVLPGWEATLAFGLRGHAGITGLPAYFKQGSGATPDARAQDYFAQVHERGGTVVVNHPRDASIPFDYSNQTAMQADAIEVWNTLWLLRDDIVPLPFLASDNPAALAWYEGLLDRGARLAAVGGSDSHWIASSALNGPGQPATWVLAAPDAASIEAAIRAGRTTVSWDFTGTELRVLASPRCDGRYDAVQGDTLPALPACLRVEVSQPGLVCVRAGGPAGHGTIAEQVVLPLAGWELRVDAPGTRWIRADDFAVEADDLVLRAVASPVYVAG